MRRLLLPLLIVFCFAAFSLIRSEPASEIVAALEPGSTRGASWVLTSRVALAVVFLLAWRLRRGRVAWAVLAVTAAGEGLGLTAGSEVHGDLHLAIGLVLPMVLAGLAWLREWWVVSRTGLIRGVALGLGCLGTYALTWPQAATWLERARDWGQAPVMPEGEATAGASLSFSSRFGQWVSDLGLGGSGAGEAGSGLEMAPSVALVWIVGVVVASLALWRKRTPIEAGLVGVLIASALAYGRPEEFRYFAVACAVVLGAALVENAFTLAFHDGLTGLPARRALEERLQQVGRSYSLAMLDLDKFKLLNDKHGHEVGDQVLKLVAARMRGVTGGGEPFRYGGEEFTVVFAGRSAVEAQAHMDALRQEIAGRKFVVRSPGRPKKKPKGALPSRPSTITKELKVTVSVGIAERSAKYPTKDDVMKAADQALYRSKKAGRNRVTLAK